MLRNLFNTSKRLKALCFLRLLLYSCKCHVTILLLSIWWFISLISGLC